MALTAGLLSKVSIGSTTASVLSGAATGGTGPYTYQWYKSLTTGFTPGAGNLIAGATSLALSDSGLLAGTTYFYKVVSIDTGAGNATITSAQLQVGTVPVQELNQFIQSPLLGVPDLKFSQNTISVQIDSTQATPLLAGSAVKCVDSAGGVMKVVGCSANSDEVMGFIVYDIKSQQFVAGDRAEIARKGDVLYLIAAGPIARGAQVTLDLSYAGGVGAKNTGDKIIGYAEDKASGSGQLIRVHLATPSFTVA